ncbi:unnamed protein product [Aphanomyces euteiches]
MDFFTQWNDDDRMEALYSSSAVQDENLLHTWIPAVHWTTRGLALEKDGACSRKFKTSFLIRGDTLSKRFIRKGIEPVPVVMTHVLKRMLETKELVPVDEFKDAATSERSSWSSWLVEKTVVHPTRWGLRSLQHLLLGDDDSSLTPAKLTGPYVSMKALATAADTVFAFASKELEPMDLTVCLYREDHTSCSSSLSCSFRSLCLRVAATAKSPNDDVSMLADIDPTELDLLVLHLVATKRAVVQSNFVKLLVHSQTFSSGDESIVLLQHMVATVETSLDKLHRKIQAAKMKAIELKRAEIIKEAIVYLRHVKAMEASQAQREACLANLLATDHQLREMHMQALIVDGYKLAASSLRSVRSDLGLHVDAVEDAVAEWQAVHDEANQIDALLRQPGQDAVGGKDDDAALQAELDAWLGSTEAVAPAEPSKMSILEAMLPEAPTETPETEDVDTLSSRFAKVALESS